MKVKAILFDLDGVLLDTEKIYNKYWKQAASELGFDLADEIFLQLRSCDSSIARRIVDTAAGVDGAYDRIRARRKVLGHNSKCGGVRGNSDAAIFSFESKNILTNVYVSGIVHIDANLCEVMIMKREEVSLVCKAMSDANRLRIIEMLTTGEKCGCDLLDELQVTQPTLSHHMKVLAECGLVSSRKEGKWQHYSINCERFMEFKDHLNSISCCTSAANDKVSEKSCCYR